MLFAKENYAERSLANVAPKPGLDNDDQEKVKVKKSESGNKKGKCCTKARAGRGGRCSLFLTMRCFNDAMFPNSLRCNF